MKLELTIDEVNVIIASLAKQPFEAVSDTINKIREQAIPQVQAEQEAQQEAQPDSEAA